MKKRHVYLKLTSLEEAREKFLWRPFAAATSEDVPVADEDDDGDDTNT